MIYGFTGASRLTPDMRAMAESYLAGLIEDGPLKDAAAFVTGTQVGIDELVAEKLVREFPVRPLTQIIPGKPGTHGRLAEGPAAGVLPLPDGFSVREVYRARNEVIIYRSDALIAFPEGPEASFPRSGTWMTVRMARAAGLPIRIFPLNGDAPYEEGREQ